MIEGDERGRVGLSPQQSLSLSFFFAFRNQNACSSSSPCFFVFYFTTPHAYVTLTFSLCLNGSIHLIPYNVKSNLTRLHSPPASKNICIYRLMVPIRAYCIDIEQCYWQCSEIVIYTSSWVYLIKVMVKQYIKIVMSSSLMDAINVIDRSYFISLITILYHIYATCMLDF